MLNRVAVSFLLALGVGYSGVSAAASEGSLELRLVDVATMDQVVKESAGEIQLARRGDGDGRRDGRRGDRWVAPAVAAALIGAAIASSNARADNDDRRDHRDYRDYRDRRDYGRDDGYRSAKRRCARDFPSYNWRSDTIIGRGGRERICPYVRDYY
jgi:hypothetical protein